MDSCGEKPTFRIGHTIPIQVWGDIPGNDVSWSMAIVYGQPEMVVIGPMKATMASFYEVKGHYSNALKMLVILMPNRSFSIANVHLTEAVVNGEQMPTLIANHGGMIANYIQNVVTSQPNTWYPCALLILVVIVIIFLVIEHNDS